MQITLADPAAMGALRISGSFHTGDNKVFAQAMASLFGLVVKRRGEAFELSASPSDAASIRKGVEKIR